jgi:hypothetical protein
MDLKKKIARFTEAFLRASEEMMTFPALNWITWTLLLSIFAGPVAIAYPIYAWLFRFTKYLSEDTA